jgi:serine/threonine protein kinase
MQPEEWPRARTVLTSAVKLATGDRSRVISAAYPDDPELLRELLSILDSFDKVAPQEPVASVGPEVPVPAPATPAIPNEPLLTVGATYGPYRVLGLLGAGGMGQVFLAEDVRLGRRVAIKSLAGRWLESSTARPRLMREARAAAALTHPHIATLYDVLEDAGHLLLVMEYVEGRPVSALLEDGPIAVGHALRLAIQITDAVGFAHDHGIIHCDIKPANLLVTADGVAKVLDFGLARARFDPNEWEEQTPGKILGTPGYMAPERLARGTLNASGDVYSLGVVIFEMTTGRRPFDEGDLSALLLTVFAGCPPTPSSIVPEIPPALDAVVDRALARAPAQRYQSVRALRRDLQDVLESIDPAAPSRAADTTPASHHRGRVIVGATVGTLLALTLLGFITETSYNSPLGLTDGFERETPWSWPLWGFRAILAPFMFMAMAAVAFVLLAGVCRLSLATSGRLRRWCAPVATGAHNASNWMQTVPGGKLAAAALLLAQVIVLVLFVWRVWPIMAALDTFKTREMPGSLAALGPANRPEHRFLWLGLSVQLQVFGLCWYLVLSRAWRRNERDTIALAVAGLSVAALCLIFFQVVPFRILYHNEAQRVSYGSHVCYLVGQRADEARLFCPQSPRRNQIVKLTDKALVREPTYEGIFDALDANH